MASSRVAIGIDLGTTYSCVAVYCKGRNADDEAGAGVKVIDNDSGHNTTPSCVAFNDTDRLIGDAAKMQIIQNPQNTIYGIKRLMGRKFDDESVQDDIERWPFTVAERNGKPVVRVEHEDQVKEFAPEQISAMILGKMKEIAEVHCTIEKVTDAVVTVPAYFDNSQRQATVDAGKIAGLNVLQILNEPTAAALAYGIDRNVNKKTNVLIYDLGGGTFDVSIVEIENGTFNVIASGGDVHLGGEDFDMLLVDHFICEIKLKYKTDISENKRSVQRLKKTCENAKRKLSSVKRTDIDIDCLMGETDYHAKLSRSSLDELCKDLFKKTIEIVADTLEKARMDKDELDEIVLVGGSTRIVKIQSLLQEFFDGRQLNKTINPDEAVAYGAAVKAALLTGQITPEDVKVSDVIPMSLGIETLGGMSTIIERNTKIPAKRVRKNYTTCRDNQPTMDIQVFVGENMDTARNHLLDSFTLADIQKAPRAVPSIDVTFAVDANGILKVSAIDQATKSKNQITIKSSTGRLGKWAMKRMIAEAKDLDGADRRRQECDAARNSLEEYCFTAKMAVEDGGQAEGSVTEDEREEVLEACNAVLEWLEANEKATKEQVEEEKEKLSHLCQNFLD